MEYICLELLVVLLHACSITSADDLDKLCRLKSTINDAVECYDKFESHTHSWLICEESSSSNDCFPLHNYMEFLRKHKQEPADDYTDDYRYYDYHYYQDKLTDLTNHSQVEPTIMGNATLINRTNEHNSTQSLEQAEILVERGDECPKVPLVAISVLFLLGGIIIGCVLTILVLKIWKKTDRSCLCLRFGKHKEHDLQHIHPDSGDSTPQEEPLVNQYEALKPIHLGSPDDKTFANRASLHHYLSINENENEIYENVKYQRNHVDNNFESETKAVEEYDGYRYDTVNAPKCHTVNFVTNNDSNGYIDCSGTSRNGYIESQDGNMSESDGDDEQSGDIRAPMVNELKESVKRFKEAGDEDESEYVEPNKDDMYMNSGEYLRDMANDEQEIYQNS